MTRTLCFLLCVVGTISAPVDDPVRIDLPVYDHPKSASSDSTTKPLDPDNHPVPRNNPDTRSKSAMVSLSNQINSNTPIGYIDHGSGIFSSSVTKLDGAILETEDLGSKLHSVNENVQNVIAGIFQPKPIVDTIKEEEKYGNSGDKFQSTGRAIVNGAEGISNFVNSILETPSRIFKSITRAASEKLNNLGSKLVGL